MLSLYEVYVIEIYCLMHLRKCIKIYTIKINLPIKKHIKIPIFQVSNKQFAGKPLRVYCQRFGKTLTKGWQDVAKGLAKP